MRKVVIIGAGLAGLAAGIQLAASGVEVEIYEKNSHAGGKMMSVDLEGYHFDFGPNTITMPHVFQSVLKLGGQKWVDKLSFTKLIDHTMNYFQDGTTLLQTANRDKMVGELAKLDARAAKNYDAYLKEVNRLYTLADQQFFYRTFTGLKDYMAPELALALLRVRPLENMDHFHRRYFSDERVLKAFNRYSTYIGSSPYACPATFALIGALEMNEGVFYVKGGNVKIAEVFANLFQSLGGKLFLNREVRHFLTNNGRIEGLELMTGERTEATHCLVNGDLLTSYRYLIKEMDRPHMTDQKLESYQPSISSFVILAGVKKQAQLAHHQVFFTGHYRQEFAEIFQQKKLPTDPTIYISNSSATDESVTKGSNLFILVNAPALPAITLEEQQRYKELIYDKLETNGLDIRSALEVEQVITSKDIKNKFYAYKGALYGARSHTLKDAFLRPTNKDRRIEGLYFAGGTTHPGGGSPMVTISGLNTARLLLNN